MVLGDQALIVCLLGFSTSGNSWSISTNDRDLLVNGDSLLCSCRRTLGALSTLSSTLGLWEECLDPGLVYEVEGTGESCEEEKVEEDARKG